MSKRGYISRYLLIIKKLKAKPYSSFDELHSYMEHQLSYLQMQDDLLEIGFSKRTFQRDLREIRNVFGIDIEYSKENKGYYILQDHAENMNFQRMMEAFDVFNSLKIANDQTPYIHLEKRRPQGSEHLYGLLHAIRNRLQVRFTYKKFWDDDISQRTIDPYVLKEFRNRWYIMAKDHKDNVVKSFGLDRISNLEITSAKFTYPEDNTIERSYRYCFGIEGPSLEEPEIIILSFDPIQGKYIKTLPLHHTQEIIADNEEETRLQLKLHITHDFIMELLSFGGYVKVLAPASLAEAVKAAHQDAIELYE
jgi:predicted DNA-binding transcriptional regulator YafY